MYPFEILVVGFDADDDFIYEAKFENGFVVTDDNFNKETTSLREMFELVFDPEYGNTAKWILERWRTMEK